MKYADFSGCFKHRLSNCGALPWYESLMAESRISLYSTRISLLQSWSITVLALVRLLMSLQEEGFIFLVYCTSFAAMIPCYLSVSSLKIVFKNRILVLRFIDCKWILDFTFSWTSEHYLNNCSVSSVSLHSSAAGFVINCSSGQFDSCFFGCLFTPLPMAKNCLWL